MQKFYNSEIQGMIDFWEEIGLSPDALCPFDRYDLHGLHFGKIDV